MHGGSKQLGRKLETLTNVEMNAKEQQDPDRKAQDSLDNLIKQTIGREPFLSFTRAGESPVQWIQFFDTLDQNASKISKGVKVEAGVENSGQEHNFKPGNLPATVNGTTMKGNGVFGRGLQASADRMQSLKLPDAVVAFAQAAAKANDMPGWPLMTPKVQVQKCGKCSEDFYSTLNYRRHIRMHRRSFKVDKEDLKSERENLGAFWDKLTLEEASHIVAVRNSSLEDLSGSSVARSLSTFIQQSGLPSLPQSYLKAGAILLDIVQKKISRFPLPSNEFFNILDDCSERTFLCGFQSGSMQRFIFEGEAGKVGLETKNLVASLGFLIEQRLVKAWMADKDVEALRCQKALVEEEEAAQQKREKLQERKRLKKMRQKELKDKERRGSDAAPSNFQFCNEPKNGEMCVGHHEGDDSLTVVQSSPLSIGYSRQEFNHPDSSNMDFNEFEGSGNGRINNIFLRLADKESFVDADKQGGGGWTGSADAVRRNADVEEAAASVGYRIKDGEGQHGFPANDRDSDTISQDKVEELIDVQNVARSASDRKTGLGWRERKRYESTNDFMSNSKSFHGIDKRFYDTDSSQNSRVTRKLHNFEVSSTQDHIGVLAHTEQFTGPRYGQYRPKTLGVRRFLSTASNSHAVWTRKVHQNSVPELDMVGKPNDSSKGQSLVFCNNSTSVPEASGLVDGFATGNNIQDTCESKFDRISGRTPSDSSATEATTSAGSSASLASISSRTRVEEESTDNICTPANGAEVTGLSWQLLDNCSALVIGSLSVPLGDFSDTNGSGDSQEKSEQLSREMGDVSWENSNGETATKQDVVPSLKLVKDRVRLDYGAEAAACKSPRVSFEDSGDISCQKPEISESLPQISPGHERVTKQGHWPNALQKLSTLKVWRPVGGVTERHEGHANDLVSGADNGSMHVGEECRLDLPRDGAVAQVGSNRRVCQVFDKGSVGRNNDDINASMGTVSKYREEPSNVGVVGLTDTILTKVDEMLETKGYEPISWASSTEIVANFLSQRWADAVTTESTVLASDENGLLSSALGTGMDVPDKIQQQLNVSLVSSQDGKVSNLKSLQEKCSNLKTVTDGTKQSVSIGLETGAIQHTLCSEADSDLLASPSSAIETTVYKVRGLEKQGEASLLSGPSNGKIKSEKWHENPRARVFEPRYTPRSKDLEEN